MLFKRMLSADDSGWASPVAEAPLLPVSSDQLEELSDVEDDGGYAIPMTSTPRSARRHQEGTDGNGDASVDVEVRPGG